METKYRTYLLEGSYKPPALRQVDFSVHWIATSPKKAMEQARAVSI